MNKDRFYELLHYPQVSYSDEDVALLREMVNQYPYFHAAHLLLAKAEYSRNSIHYEKSLQNAAAYAGDRELLYSLINNADENAPTAIPEPVAREPIAPAPPEFSAYPAEAAPPPFPEENAYREPFYPAEETKLEEGEKAPEIPPQEEEFPQEAIEKPAPLPEEEQVAENAQEFIEEKSSQNISETDLPAEEKQETEEEEKFSQEPGPAPDGPFQESAYDQPEEGLETDFEPAAEEKPEEAEEEHPGIPNPEEGTSPTTLPPLQFEYPLYDLEREIAHKAPEKSSQNEGPEVENTASAGSEVPENLQEGISSAADVEELPEPETAPEKTSPPKEKLSFAEWLKVLNKKGKEDKVPANEELLAQKETTEEPQPENQDAKKTSQPEPAPNATLQLIDKFIEQEPRIKPVKSSFFSPAGMAQKSVEEPEDIATETLAQIYLQQGNNKKAMKIYEKLALIYPEKSNYFAARIEETKKKE